MDKPQEPEIQLSMISLPFDQSETRRKLVKDFCASVKPIDEHFDWEVASSLLFETVGESNGTT